MRKRILPLVQIAAVGLLTANLFAGVAYPDPFGGWTYIYNGDKDVAEETDPLSFDGTWGHNNGSDQWDGSGLGGDFVSDIFGVGNAPGGAMALAESGISYLRIQSPGNPSHYGFAEPSNRKLYFGHDMTSEGAPDTILDDGITFTFRARVPTPANTTGPLDPIFADGQSAAGGTPYPAGGDGYLVSDGGKGNFVIKQAGGGAIAFALTTPNDLFGGDPAGAKADFSGLTMNQFNGNAISADIDFGEAQFVGVPFDSTEWHEIWVVLQKDPTNVGTHQAFIFLDGSKDPTVLSLTAGDGSDFGGSYLAMGGSRTAESFALDVDFVAYKFGARFPPGALEKPFLGGFTGSPVGFTMSLTDGITGHATTVNEATLTARLDGHVITPTVLKTDSTTTIRYQSSAIFVPGSSHKVTVMFADTGTPEETITIEREFTVGNYATLPGSMTLDSANLDRSKRGFKIRPFGTDENNPNTLAWTEEALAGQHGSNAAETFGGDANGFYVVETVINFDIDVGAGNFTAANGHLDDPFPGFPGFGALDGGNGNAIEEILTLVEFPRAGFYTMGVNSDDGFRLSVGAPDPRDLPNAMILGEFDGARSAADTLFGFRVASAGVYAFRLIWENGDGEASLEWFTVQPDGTKVLVNDTATDGALAAYQFQVLDVKPSVTPTIGYERTGQQLTLTFEGTLQSADTLAGPWIDVAGAPNPYTQSTAGGLRFYRTRQ